jgi:hypothetical protein
LGAASKRWDLSIRGEAGADRTNGLDWTQLREVFTEEGDSFFDSIYAPNAGDYNSVGQRSLRGLAYILELLAEGILPLCADSGEMLEHVSFSWEHHVLGECGSTTLLAVVRRETTHLDANGAMLDVPMEMDLHSMTTCKSLTDYVLAAKDKLLVEGTTDDGGQELLDVQSIRKDVKPALIGDGLPLNDALS